MKRETTNKIRFVLEDILPPILRDSFLFKGLARLVWGKHISELAKFRADAPFLTEQQYEDLYRHHPRVHEGTDNSQACIEKIISDIEGTTVCDIGCGTGYLISEVQKNCPNLDRYVGVDFVVEDAKSRDGIEYVAAKIEDLPFDDGEFDTVICTHVIEHVLDYRKAISELRRIAKKRLIIIVPREREYRYTFNPHFHFFPYTHSFLRAVQPLSEEFICEDIHRDIYYRESVLWSSGKTQSKAA